MIKTLSPFTVSERYKCMVCDAEFFFSQRTAAKGEKFFTPSNNPPNYCPVCGQQDSESSALFSDRLQARFPWLVQEDGYLPHSFSEDVTKLRALFEELRQEEARARLR